MFSGQLSSNSDAFGMLQFQLRQSINNNGIFSPNFTPSTRICLLNEKMIALVVGICYPNCMYDKDLKSEIRNFALQPEILLDSWQAKRQSRAYPKPHFIFWLEPKNEAKKFKTAPASLEKLTLSWLKPSKLAPSSLKQDSFKRQLHLFFGSPDEVTRLQTV